MTYPDYVPDEQLSEIPFEPKHAQKLEDMGFERTGKTHIEYVLSLNVGSSEIEVDIDATMYNTGRAVLNVTDEKGETIFHITGPPDFIINKVREAVTRIQQQTSPRWEMTETKTRISKGNPEFRKQLGSLYRYVEEHLGIQEMPKLTLTNDVKNANEPFGLTGYYNPETRSIRLYMTERHPTDVLRSFAHELIHHWQNENGKLPPQNGGAEHYAQKDPVLRQCEMEAYLIGNILFRDWQDENRYGPINENITLANYDDVEKVLTSALTQLVRSGAIKSHHCPATSGNMITQDFVENIVRMLILQLNKYLQNTNNKGNWENQMQMVK